MQNNVKDSLSKTIFKYASGHIYKNILGVFSAFIKPKLLTPELFGLWNILSIIPTYANYSHLGTLEALKYKIPYHEAKKEHHKNEEIKSTSFYGSLYLNLLVAAGLISFFFIGNLNAEQKTGVLTMSVIVILAWYAQNYRVRLKAYQKFNIITSSVYLSSNIMFFSTIILVYLFGIYGVYLAGILTLTTVIFYFKTKYPLGTHSKFKYNIFKDLVKVGLPITFFNICTELIRSSDKIIISYFLGNKLLGYYGISSMVVGFLMNVPRVSREVFEPRLMQEIDNSKEDNLNEYFLKPLINTAYYMPFPIGAVFLIFPVLIPLILPRYVEGIIPTQILVLGSYFLSLSYMARGIIVANKWQLKASLIMLFVLPVNIGLSVFSIKSGFGINGVAFGSSISFFILFISFLIFIKSKCNYSQQDWRRNLVAICWPFPIMCAVLAVLQVLSRVFFTNEYLATVINLIVFGIIMVLLLNYSSKKIPLLKKIKIKKIFQ